MRLADVVRSTSFQFAWILTVVFLAAYAIAGSIVFRSIDRDLRERVVESTELLAQRLEVRYQIGGEAALVSAVQAMTVELDPEDQFAWLGRMDGTRVAGLDLPAPLDLTDGDVPGRDLGIEDDETAHVATVRLGDLYLIAGTSYEEVDEIREHVLLVFAWATAFILVLATGTALLLASRGQRRIEAIIATLSDVSRGKMSARVPTATSQDDLDRLSVGINAALERLETTVDSIRQVTTDIAHDLRTPINRLGILLEEASSGSHGNEKLDDALEKAAREIDQVMATFDALLRIAQIESGTRKARFAPVSLRQIAVSLHETYGPVAAESGQSLALGELPGTTALIDGDAELLTQLFANLIENSIRHCPSGTAIQIEGGTTKSNKIWMRVWDDGPGIAESDRDQVFKRFYRVERSRHTPGTGLGLAVVKAIADLHGATLQLADRDPGLQVDLQFPRAHRNSGPVP